MIKRGLFGFPRFKDILNFVFIDDYEKWFYLSQKIEKYYLLPEEDEFHRTSKNKNYIPRLMFCVFVLGQGLGMGSAFLMVSLVVFLLSLMSRL